jgi:O-antigen/teichoic acid export membrane protein
MPKAGTMSLGRAVVWFGAAYAVAIGGYLALSAAAGRLLGPDEFGYFVAALTLSMVMAQIGLVGVHRSGLREAARLRPEDVEQLSELRRGVRAVVQISLPVVAFVTGAIAWCLATGQPVLYRLVLSFSVAALVFLSGLQRLWANYLRGFGRVRMASALEGRSGGALVAVLQAVLVICVWQIFPSWGLPGALAAVALGYAIPVGAASSLVSRHWEHASSETRVLKDLRRVVVRDWRFASGQVALLLNASVEIWIAGLLLSSYDTSMFGAAQRLSLMVVFPMTAIQVVLSPTVSRLASSGSQQDTRSRLARRARRFDLERLLRTGSTLATAATMVLCLPLLIAPGPLLRLVYGPGFQSAVIPLLLLTAALIVNAVTGLAGLTLSMAHREGVAAKVMWGALVPRIIIGAFVSAIFGVDALALSAAVVSGSTFVLMWRCTRRIIGVNTGFTAHPDLSVIKRPAGGAV